MHGEEGSAGAATARILGGEATSDQRRKEDIRQHGLGEVIKGELTQLQKQWCHRLTVDTQTRLVVRVTQCQVAQTYNCFVQHQNLMTAVTRG